MDGFLLFLPTSYIIPIQKTLFRLQLIPTKTEKMPERVPWKESNLALIGSDLDHKIKAAAAEGESQWDGLGEGTGLKVWRIEQFKVVPWAEESYGSFHTGDSYVVLNSYQEEGSDAILHDIHIWIGSESSQDEYGTAAYKMVECDEKLGGAAIQHREVQGHESPLFQSYFRGNSLKYLQGGVDSGFTHVEPTADQPHLYRVKGTEKGMSLEQLPLKKTSLNQGDSFIVFANPSTVWVWHGTSANPDEKSRANTTAENMCTQGTVTTLEAGADADDAFWGYLEDDGDIADADEGGDEAIEKFSPLLFQLQGDGEPAKVAEGEEVKFGFGAATPKIPRSELKEGDVFLLDGGWDLFVWIGAQADRQEKVGAIGRADSYCRQSPRTADLPLTLVKAGYEPSSFSGYFFD